MEKIYRVQMNKHGMPNFATAEEVADRPKGEWIEKGYLASRRWYCSVCNEWQTYGKTKFCPQCGADMRQTEREDK